MSKELFGDIFEYLKRCNLNSICIRIVFYEYEKEDIENIEDKLNSGYYHLIKKCCKKEVFENYHIQFYNDFRKIFQKIFHENCGNSYKIDNNVIYNSYQRNNEDFLKKTFYERCKQSHEEHDDEIFDKIIGKNFNQYCEQLYKIYDSSNFDKNFYERCKDVNEIYEDKIQKSLEDLGIKNAIISRNKKPHVVLNEKGIHLNTIYFTVYIPSLPSFI